MAYKLNNNVELQPVGDQLIVLDLTGNTYYALNATARFMVELLLSGHAAEDVVIATTQQFAAENEVISRDLEALIADLVQKQLIVDSRC